MPVVALVVLALPPPIPAPAPAAQVRERWPSGDSVAVLAIPARLPVRRRIRAMSVTRTTASATEYIVLYGWVE